MERCPLSSVPRPRVTTLFANPSDPILSGYVVSPSCVEELVVEVIVESQSLIPIFNVPGRNIEAVVSIPAGVIRLEANENRISSLDLRNSTNLTIINLEANEITSVADFVFPESLLGLILDGNPIDMLHEADLPVSLHTLSLRTNGISSFAGWKFPMLLSVLDISFQDNLQSLQGLVLPPNLEMIIATNFATSIVSGVTFPPSLARIHLGGLKPLTGFDVRASDVAVFSSAQLHIMMGTNITACIDPRGSIQVLQDELQACVYPDEVFAELFPPITTPSPRESTPPTPSIDDDTNASDQPTNSPAPTISIVPPVLVPATQRVPKPATTNSSIPARTDDSSSTPPPPTNSLASSRRPNVLSTPAMVALAVSIALVAIAFVLRRRRKRASMSAKPTASAELVPLPRVVNDVREDADFYQFQIPQSDLAVQSTVVVTSIYTSVYQAKLFGREVAVTRFTSVPSQHEEDDATTSDALQSFMDEIRLWATLDHPAIVAFVGVSWTESELSLVTEWMAQGDLRSVIHREFIGATNSPPWFHYQLEGEGNTNSSEPVWSKAAIALDVAEALVYLHSFTPPILHGDVSTANVLVSSSYRAKLSNFSRSGHGDGDDDTMEYRGSSAMAPPEIQRGDRYSAKGDVYGLGTVLSELASGGVDCPMVIRELVAACLQTDPSDRPAAMEVHYRLRQAIAAAHQP